MSSRLRLPLTLAFIVGLLASSFSVAAQDDTDVNFTDIHFDHQFEIHGFDFKDPEFYDVWARTDLPVLQGEVERSWTWGPAANTEVFEEPYVEAEGGMREVQYSDKSRMEMPVAGSNAAAENDDSPWNITQGLLARELMTGELQVGDDTFLPHAPAEIPVAGDWEDNDGPTYADMAAYMDNESRTTGWTITQYFDEDGVVQDDDRFADYGVFDRYHIPETDHNIASVFWDFMQSEGLVYEDDDYTTGPVFLDEFYAIGFPLTEAYWGEFTLRGEKQDILIQCFERRCLTYAPNNAPEWQVESGNVGLHYHEWRYNIITQTELSLDLDPADATNPVDSDHTITATVMENGTALEIADQSDVSIDVSRDDDGAVTSPDVGETITVDGDGVATITYDGPEAPAVDTISVEVEYDGEMLSAEATKTWAEFDLALAQDEDFNLVGTDHTITATLTADGEPVEGAEIQFFIDHSVESVPGIGPGGIDVPEPLLTDDQGQYSYTYTRSTAGTETIEAFHPDQDGIASNPASLTKTWQEFGEFHGCDTVVENGQSIQGAVTAADSGDTICVLEGTYSEHVTVSTDDLTLLGAKTGIPAGPEESPSNRGADESIVIGGFTFSQGLSNAVVDGFTIDSGEGTGIAISNNNASHEIVNNIIEGQNATTGISTVRFDGVLVRHNNISGYDYGLNLDGDVSDQPGTVEGNYITGASIAAIQTQGSGANGHSFIDNALINNNDGSGNGAGITLVQGEHTVSGNTIDNSGFAGIYIYLTARSHDIDITNNSLLNGRWGIYVDASDASATGNSANQNCIVGNSMHGAQVADGSAPQFDATSNWWGDPGGPGSGSANTVAGNVDASSPLQTDAVCN